MGPIQVVVQDGNNLVLEVTPTPSTTVILDRGIAGPVGPAGPGNVNGPASATDNAVARFDGTTGKLIKNSVVTIGDTGNMAGVGTLAVTDLTDSSLTAGRVTYAGTGGNLVDSANMTFNGTDLTVSGAVNAGSINATTLDLTNLEVTNIKAKDGTAGMQIADSTGVVSFTSNPVLSGGVASGVAYLNGSKVLTTGSALTFDGTNLGVGVAAAYGGAYATIHALAAGGSSLRLDRTGAGTSTILSVETGVAYRDLTLDAANNIFSISGSEQMRLTSAGLGIGTSSPNAKLDVVNASGRVARIGGFQFAGTGSSTDGGNNLLSSGVYWNGSNLTATQTSGAVLQFGNGALQFQTLSGLTAGSTYSFAPQLSLDSSGNLGIGTSSPADKLHVAATGTNAGSGYLVSRFQDSFNSKGVFLGYDTDELAGTIYGVNFLTFQTFNGSAWGERMRIDSSGNLGLGVTPSAWASTHKAYQIQGGGSLYNNGADGYLNLANNFYYDGADWRRVTAAPASLYLQSSGGHLWGYVGTGTANSVCGFPTAQMTLDSSGNLGLGVTPSAWNTGIKAFDFGARGALYAVDDTNLLNNAFFDSVGWKYKAGTGVGGDGASRYNQYNGIHSWYNAPSGTAGNAISFTQAMTLDASGNLGVGLTSPTARIDAYQATQVTTTFRAYGPAGQILWANGGSSTSYLDSDTIIFRKSADGGNTERARIDSSGNLGLGITSPAYKIHASNGGNSRCDIQLTYDALGAGASDGVQFGIQSVGAYIWNFENSSVYFGTNNAERARIDSSGNLLVGTTVVTGAGASVGQIVANFDGSANNGIYVSDTRTSAGTDNAINFGRGATLVGRLDTTLTSLTLTNLSDQRVKTNVQDSQNALGLVDSIKVRQFDWTIDNSHEDFGFVAQELNEVLPQAVSVGKTEEEMWGVNFVKLVPILTKAIQEQQAIIESLKARLDAANL